MEYENTAEARKLNELTVCLNPCSNGIRKYFAIVVILSVVFSGLNPCSNGIRKYTVRSLLFRGNNFVLILVLMEY